MPRRETTREGPFPGQILTAVVVDANNRIYPLAYTIVKAESKAFWYSFNPIINLDCPQGLIQAITSMFPSAEHRFCVKHIHENMKSKFKGGVCKDMLWNAAKATIVVEFNKNIVGSSSQKSQGARQAVGARNVFSQAVVTSQQSQAPRQVIGARNASSQADGSSQQKKGPRQGAGARNASSQTAGSSQPSVAPSQASQGPSQHSVGPTQASQGPKKGFQAPIPTPYYRPQRLTKKSSSRQPSETTILF
ncbi:mutator type transposase [Tanacetum coccineum]